jgi:hypothetical protein
MNDLGLISCFLGIDFEHVNDGIKMNQTKYISKVLDRFGMSHCKPRLTPSEQKFEFSDSAESFDSNMYRNAIGSLISYGLY